MNSITAIIVSFNRPLYTLDCLNSLHKYFPNVKILVGENGNQSEEIRMKVERLGGQYIVFPFDSGVPYVRNQLFKLVNTEYVLIGDDDFYYFEKANLSRAAKFLDNHPEFSVIGGRVRTKHIIRDYQGYIHTHKGLMYDKIPAEQLYYRYCPVSRLNYCPIDMMTNFWLGRLKDLPEYEEDQKIVHEHTDYMIRLFNLGIKMAFTPQMIVDHKKREYDYPAYTQYRKRLKEKNYLVRKYGGIETDKVIIRRSLNLKFN